MIPKPLREFLNTPDEESLDNLLNSEACFWVDWREEDDAIVRYCESVLKTGTLFAKIVDADNEAGFEMYIVRHGRKTLVPLVVGPEDRHITLCTLNEVLAPEYEIRFCVASNGMDTLAFLPLESDDWAEIKAADPELMTDQFAEIRPFPNLFTEGYGAVNWKDLARNPSQKMMAIKLYRDQSECSLAEAKAVVEAYLLGNDP